MSDLASNKFKDEKNITYEIIDANSEYYKEAVKLRYEILFKPYGSKMSDFEGDKILDQNSYHLAAIADNRVIGYCRLTIKEKTGQISRVFVKDEFTKQGIGHKLINTIIKKGASADMYKIFLNSRTEAVKFYEKLGFKIDGLEFISKNSGLKLIKMTKII